MKPTRTDSGPQWTSADLAQTQIAQAQPIERFGVRLDWASMVVTLLLRLQPAEGALLVYSAIHLARNLAERLRHII